MPAKIPVTLKLDQSDWVWFQTAAARANRDGVSITASALVRKAMFDYRRAHSQPAQRKATVKAV